jgi:GWxTD domain-containing protein
MKRPGYYLLAITVCICSGAKIASTGLMADFLNSQTVRNPVFAKTIVIQPLFQVFHVTDSISELHFKINNNQLLYTKRDGQDFTSNCLIYYNLFASYNSREILESDSVRFSDVNNDNSDNFLIGKINVNVPLGKTFFLRVTVTDLNRNMSVSDILTIDKTSDLTRQNFLVTPKNSNVPLFKNYLKINDTVTVQYKKAETQKLYVKYYNRNFPLPLPPFSVTEQPHFEYKPDSLFVVESSNQGKVDFIPTEKGFYHFQTDTSSHDGLTLFIFSDNFPEIKKAEDMFYPLRFITSKEEYDSIDLSNNLKSEIEKFWLNTTNYDKEKARTIIQKYYARVQKANEQFTSYTEGWRTDRGMIYLIYGKPKSIYKAEYYEAWTYNEATNLNVYTFSFIKTMNPFTDNDYKLDRSIIYRQEWFLSVDDWRTGKMNNPED